MSTSPPKKLLNRTADKKRADGTSVQVLKINEYVQNPLYQRTNYGSFRSWLIWSGMVTCFESVFTIVTPVIYILSELLTIITERRSIINRD